MAQLRNEGLVRNRGVSHSLTILYWTRPSNENSSTFNTAVLLHEGKEDVWSAAGARVVYVYV